MLNFTDGVSVNTTGALRALRLKDGWYVVGQGMLIPVADREEAVEELRIQKELTEKSVYIAFEAYDVLQIFSDRGVWMDFYTIRDTEDAERATSFVKNGLWEGRKRSFRVVSSNKSVIKFCRAES